MLCICVAVIACSCSGAETTPTVLVDGGATDAGEAGSPSGDAAVQGGENVEIKNLSGMEVETANIRLTFALVNHAALMIDRVTEISVAVENSVNGLRTVTFAIDCQDSAWKLASGKTSPVLELKVARETNGDSKLTYGGGCSARGSSTTGGASGTLTVRIKGVFGDAAPWSAEAHVTL